MNFDLPDHLPPLLTRMDAFIEAEIVPLQAQHPQFFDERREFARTDMDRGGLPSREWEDLLGADARGSPTRPAGCATACQRRLAARTAATWTWPSSASTWPPAGLGLHNDLQDESSIVGNFPIVLMMERFGTDAQRATWTPGTADRRARRWPSA